MRVIIAGSRSLRDPALVDRAVVESGFDITEVVEGEADGIDQLAREWARAHRIPWKPFYAEWERYGKRRAGRIRNAQMGEYGEALIAITEGTGGTANMIAIARALKLPTYVLELRT